jgi:hypothetical protein
MQCKGRIVASLRGSTLLVLLLETFALHIALQVIVSLPYAKPLIKAVNGATVPDWGRSELVFGCIRLRYFQHSYLSLKPCHIVLVSSQFSFILLSAFY